MDTSRRWRVILLIVLASLALDQGTKLIARALLADHAPYRLMYGLIELRYIENHTGFLGFLASVPESVRSLFLTAGVGLLLLAAIFLLVRSPWLNLDRAVAIALLVGGGSGNLLDRLLNDGGVVDFLVIGAGPLKTGVFNLADLCVVAGGFGLGATLANNKEKHKEPDSSDPP